jgi:hypothetical protein
MSDLKIDFDSIDNVKIDLDDGFNDTGIQLSDGDNSSMMGVELLANQNSKADLTVTNHISGYSSGEESNKSVNITAPIQKDEKSDKYDFFDKNEEKDTIKSIKTESNDFSDPLINAAKEKSSINSDYKPIHSMTQQDIKNEKIDILYKFKK